MALSPRGTAAGRSVSRRRFVQGLIAGGAVAGLDFLPWRAFALTNSMNPPLGLTGNHFDLVVEDVPVNFTGRPATATGVNGSVPAPTLRWREGDTVTISVTNHLPEPTSIHWHGVRTPSDMDGVPGLSFPGIPAGNTFVYQFPIRQHGTYWYHSHSRFQEQTGHYGALIIDPRSKDPIEYDREYVIVLSDWTDEDPETLFSNLKQQSDYYNFHRRTVGTFLSDSENQGLGPTISDRLMWGRMNMAPTDILDVSGATYTYIINGQPPAANWTALFRPHERIRLRFINASSMTIFDVRIPGLPMTVVQTDGNDVEPVTVDEFRISVAETYDVVVQPHDASAFTIFAQSEDRTGYARGTLAPRPGMAGEIPEMDPRPLRTMADMGMGNMSGMNMGGTPGAGKENMPGMEVGPGDSGQMPGMKHEMAPASKPHEMHSAPKHHMRGMKMAPASAAHHEMKRGDMSGMSRGGDMPGMKMESGMSGMKMDQPSASVTTGQPKLSVEVQEGPEVAGVAMMPTERLSDPGEGFPPDRRVLAYSDLRARFKGTDPRPATREIELHLTGNMERFIWGFDGKKFTEADPIRLKLGERVRFTLINDSMMEHPIHLHGLWSELDNGHGEFRPYKHTINVKPGERLSYLISADTPGHWAFHCHLLYHMEAGMFRTVIVS